MLNTIGSVPLEWYTKNFAHIGYDIEGKKIDQVEKSKIDGLIDRVGNPDAWRTVEDIYNGREIVIDDEIISKVKMMMKNQSAGTGLNQMSVIP